MAHTNGVKDGSGGIYLPPKDGFVPLIIDGKDVKLEQTDRHYQLPHTNDPTAPSSTTFQGATNELTLKAIESAEKAFKEWSQTIPPVRRALLNKFAQAIQDNAEAIKELIKEEIHCNQFWAELQIAISVSIIDETAASISSESMNGQIPYSVVPGAYPLVFNEPLGVVLGMAPWNAPLILGIRSICAPIAAGNTVIFRGSEFSPRSHYLIASLIREVGFPPGVCNLLLHRPEDAAETFNTAISHRAVKKANFTGSTPIGRSIAATAAKYLKPVLLELGGKNISIVLDDANVELAAKESLDAAIMNNGQVCMCTDTVLVHHAVAQAFTSALHHLVKSTPDKQHHVISSKGRSNISRLIEEAKAHGATVTQAEASDHGNLVPVTVIEGLPGEASWHSTESFGPLLAVRIVESEDDILELFHESGYGLSSSIFSQNHLRAINLARKLEVGAVHINSGSVHDEGNHPHGGVGESGFGRFGGSWGLREFTRPKVVMVYPS